MSITPRPYLSFSQLTLYERSPEQYADEYLYNKKRRISRNMAYGSLMAEGLENEEASGDPLLDIMMSRLPKFALMDKPVMADLKDGKGVIHLLAKPDTAKKDYSEFDEYKTSVRKWTKKMADDSGQITFYATVIWLKTGKIPKRMRLIDVPVEYLPDGSLRPTGEIVIFETQRTMTDIIKMTKRIRHGWHGILELCEKELT